MNITFAAVPAGARWHVLVSKETTTLYFVTVDHDAFTYEDDRNCTGLADAVRARALRLLSRGDATVIGSHAARRSLAYRSEQVEPHGGAASGERPAEAGAWL